MPVYGHIQAQEGLPFLVCPWVSTAQTVCQPRTIHGLQLGHDVMLQT